MDTLQSQIESFIKKEVLPQIASHGGDIKIKSIKDKVVTITLLGNCSKCPLSQITFEDIVKEKLLNEFQGQVEDVRLYNEISDELWNFAKKCLKGEKNGLKAII